MIVEAWPTKRSIISDGTAPACLRYSDAYLSFHVSLSVSCFLCVCFYLVENCDFLELGWDHQKHDADAAQHRLTFDHGYKRIVKQCQNIEQLPVRTTRKWKVMRMRWSFGWPFRRRTAAATDIHSFLTLCHRGNRPPRGLLAMDPSLHGLLALAEG